MMMMMMMMIVTMETGGCNVSDALPSTHSTGIV
jgi:hypothetical protein